MAEIGTLTTGGVRLDAAAGTALRAAAGLWIFLKNGSAPGHNDAFNGPFDFFLALAHTLLPVAILELYLFTQDRAGAPGRLAMAAGLMVCTVATGIGIFMAAQIFWLPRLF
jgi:hypothetical protein